jgi:predicted SAM-dependent methyltransferase
VLHRTLKNPRFIELSPASTRMSLSYKVERWRQKLAAKVRMMKLRMNPPPMPQHPDGKVLLHIGCGDVHSPEFINIDARKMPHVHIVTEDIFNLGQFPNSSVDFIYMSHLLEHVRRKDQRKVLDEMFRVLKPGGVLRLGVPDFDLLLEMYIATGRNTRAIEPILMGGQDYEYNYHYVIFNQASITELLKEVGFREVRKWNPEGDALHKFHDQADRLAQWGGKTYPFSLNVEGVK